MDGRSVHKDLVTKEGQPYKAWMQLDFENKGKNNNFEVKQFHEKYGFDLKAAVEKFHITDLKEPDKEKALMQSLQKGNVQSVTIEKDGSSHKMFIEADPQFKKVNLYDSNMKLVAKESVEIYQSVGKTEPNMAVKEEMGNDKKKELKQELKPEKEKVEKKNNKTLLPKKREHRKKGLGVSYAKFSGDKFPSTEAFRQDQGGFKLFLGARKEEGGISDLYRYNKVPLFKVDMRIKFDDKGNFTGVYNKENGKDVFYNKNDWNKKIQTNWDKQNSQK